MNQLYELGHAWLKIHREYQGGFGDSEEVKSEFENIEQRLHDAMLEQNIEVVVIGINAIVDVDEERGLVLMSAYNSEVD